MQHPNLNRYAQGGVVIAAIVSTLYLIGIVLFFLGILQPALSGWLHGEGLSFTWDIDRVNPGRNLMLMLPSVLEVAVIIYCCMQTLALLRRFNRGEYFTQSNFSRLRNMGMAITVLQLAFGVLLLLGAVFQSFAIGDRQLLLFLLLMPFELEWLIIGFILIVLARAFRRGVILEETHKNIV